MREAEALPRTVADPGLLAVHRPRHRHAPRHEAGGARGRLRLLAAVPLRPDHAGTGHEPVPARLAAAAHSARGVPLQRGPLQVADPDAPGRGEADARAGAARRRGALPAVRGPRRRATAAGSTRTGRTSHHEARHTLSRPAARAPDCRLGVAAHRHARRHAPARGCRRRRGRDVVALRGADPRRGHGLRALHGARLGQPGRGGLVLSRARRLRRRRLRSSRDAAPRDRGARHSGDRQPQRHDLRGLDRARAHASSRRAPRRSSSTSIRFRSIPPSAAPRSSDAASRSSAQVKSSVRIPISVKLAPYFSSLPHMAAELVRAGADGLVLFNRFYAPDIDLADAARDEQSLPLSTAAELPLSLVWIGLLSRRVECSLAASRGVETEIEVVKYLLAGADVVMTTSALLRHGPQHVATMRDGLERWLVGQPLRLGRCDSRPQGRDARRGRRRVSPRPVRGGAHRTTCPESSSSRRAPEDGDTAWTGSGRSSKRRR